MVSVQSMAKKMSAVFFAVSLLFASSVAEGVTEKGVADREAADTGEGLAAGIVSRADADIQIRRIKIMMATSRTDADTEIEQLEKLQKILHGQN